MHETTGQPDHRLRRRTLTVAGGMLGAAGLVVGGVSAATAIQPTSPLAARLVTASAPGPTGADQAALLYLSTHYSGTGTAQVLKTEPDVEHGVAVYDVRAVAPNGTTYVVQVQRSNDAVLSASAAESQTHTTTPVTTTPITPAPETPEPASPEPASPAVGTSPPSLPVPSTTEPAQAPEPVETPSASSASPSSDVSSGDAGTTTQSSTSGDASTTAQSSTSGDGTKTQSATSGDASTTAQSTTSGDGTKTQSASKGGDN